MARSGVKFGGQTRGGHEDRADCYLVAEIPGHRPKRSGDVCRVSDEGRGGAPGKTRTRLPVYEFQVAMGATAGACGASRWRC